MAITCYNRLSVVGSRDALAAFRAGVRGHYVRRPGAGLGAEQEFCLNALIPAPTDADDGSWVFPFAWCREHWGAERDVSHGELVADHVRWLTWSFRSAWGPPRAWLETASSMFPLLYVCTWHQAYGSSGSMAHFDGRTIDEWCDLLDAYALRPPDGDPDGVTLAASLDAERRYHETYLLETVELLEDPARI